MASFAGTVRTPDVRPTVCFKLEFLLATGALELSPRSGVESQCMSGENLRVAESDAALCAQRAPEGAMFLPDMGNEVAAPVVHAVAVRTSEWAAGRCLTSQPSDGDSYARH